MENTIFSEFEIIQEIGAGGFGEVHKAKLNSTGEIVAIKFIHTNKLNDDELRRFSREIKIHKQLNHQNIIGVLSYDTESSRPYYIMPLAENNFNQLIVDYRMDNLGSMPEDEILFYFMQILDGIEYAHSEGVIHRDLNPKNILVFNDGRNLKISDFGFGKITNSESRTLTRTQTALGNEIYTAPEQWEEGNARHVDERSDIYSLGKILYELITNSVPYIIDFEKIKDSKFNYIIRKATKSNKLERYPSIKKFKEDIDYIISRGKFVFDVPAEAFDSLLSEYNSNFDSQKIEEILDLFISNNNDIDLFESRFMSLDKIQLINMYNDHKEKFLIVVEHYLHNIRGYHSFSFTDDIADFLSAILDIITIEVELKETILKRILNLGYDHNRFYVGNTFSKIVANMRTPNEILMVTSVLEDNPVASNWAKDYLYDHQLAPRILQILKEL